MFQLAGDLGLLQEAGGPGRVARPVGPQLLEGDVAAEVGVVGQPDLADAALAVQAEQGVTLAGLGAAIKQAHDQHWKDIKLVVYEP